MPIRPPQLRKTVLRAGGDALAIPAIKDLEAAQARHSTETWVLLVDLAPGRYGTLVLGDLERDGLDARLREQPGLRLRDVVRPALTADAEEDELQEIADDYGKLSNQGEKLAAFAVVLRDDQPLGVVRVGRPGGNLTVELDLPFIQGVLPSQVRPLPQRTDRYVNTDFADVATPDQVLKRTIALQPGERYCFRVQIGELEATSIEAQATQIQAELLQSDIVLAVVVFSEDFELTETIGTIFVPVVGATSVDSPASLPDDLPYDTGVATERLLFEVRAPKRPGVATLRCGIYFRGVLIQSRLVSAVVGQGEALDERGSLRRSVLDFNLSSSLTAQILAPVEEHRLSLMLNSTADGSHAFRMVANDGQELFAGSATLSATELADQVRLTRERLREIAWGKPSEWSSEPYRYDPQVAAGDRAARLREDLVRLAVRGAMLYNSTIKDLAGGTAGQRELRALMKTPGMIQLASKITANDIVPIALFYDARIDTQAQLSICPAFEQSLASGRPLIDEPCFRGECPSAGNLAVVCPSGFWGFRHEIGMPYPVRPRGPELATSIAYSGTPQLDIAFFSDFPQVNAHLERVGRIGYAAEQSSPRAQVFELLQRSHPQLVYFYCHGVDANGIPLIRVGGEGDKDYISTDNFANYEIGWPEQRPLVFINGCHTAALTPERALNFVKTFVEDTSAAGVIGTEITIFEPLAQQFAELFLKLFLAGTPLGRAIRMARLDLLAAHNPLGLVYLPHAYAGLRLVANG